MVDTCYVTVKAKFYIFNAWTRQFYCSTARKDIITYLWHVSIKCMMIIQKITLHGYGIESHQCMDDCHYFKLENN